MNRQGSLAPTNGAASGDGVGQGTGRRHSTRGKLGGVAVRFVPAPDREQRLASLGSVLLRLVEAAAPLVVEEGKVP